MQIKLGTDFKANVEQGLEPEQKKKQEKGKEDFETRFSHCSKVSIDPIYPPKVSKCIHWSKLGIYPTYPRYLALATKATSLKQWQCQNVMCDLYCRWFFEISQYFATVEENYKRTAGRSSPSSLQLVVRNVEETLFQHQPPETTTQIELFSNINFAQFSLLKKSKKSRGNCCQFEWVLSRNMKMNDSQIRKCDVNWLKLDWKHRDLQSGCQ